MRRLTVNLAVVVATGAAVVLGGSAVAQASTLVVAHDKAVSGKDGKGPGDQPCWDWQVAPPKPQE